MRNNRMISIAYLGLTSGEKQLLSLLQAGDVQKAQVISFLNRYDIEREAAATTFYINVLIDEFSLDESDSAIIPRIQGLKEYFRYHNLTVLSRLHSEDEIADHNVLLRLLFPEEVRPFTSVDKAMSRIDLARLFGKRFADRIFMRSKVIMLQNREYVIPDEAYLSDLLWMELYRSVFYNSGRGTFCLLYDLYRYCKGRTPGLYVRFFILSKGIRHELGRLKRWLLRSGS